VEARAEGVPPATASCYSAGLRVRVTPRAGLLQASRPADAGETSTSGIAQLTNNLTLMMHWLTWQVCKKFAVMYIG
jgi:hypothetical protein